MKQIIINKNRNPIIPLDYPDPDVIRVDNVYYMVTTTMYFMPGCEILRSYDLVSWEHAGLYMTDWTVRRSRPCIMTRMLTEKECGQPVCAIIRVFFIFALWQMIREKPICSDPLL